jgi:hypothetical protein
MGQLLILTRPLRQLTPEFPRQSCIEIVALSNFSPGETHRLVGRENPD